MEKKKILVLGAGKSATVLIQYLLQHAGRENWKVVVADVDAELAAEKIGGSGLAEAVGLDLMDSEHRSSLICNAEIVISMLPPALHAVVADDCLLYEKNLLTASYVDERLRSMEQRILSKGLLFLCEMGLDPGIDHMSAMKAINRLRKAGATILSFRSHCGGLVAPESDDNPWHYKISWNPKNVVLAGKSGAHFRENGKERHLPHAALFDPERKVEIPDVGTLSWYPNRDSLSYAPLYGLEGLPTFIRTTLRHPHFMQGWKKLVDLNLTDENGRIATDNLSLAEIFNKHMEGQYNDKTGPGLESGLTGVSEETETAPILKAQLQHLGFDDHGTLVNMGECSPAEILQFAIEKKLALAPDDKDMVVMLHEIGYSLNGKHYCLKSSLVVKGEDQLLTAMAKTVGLPLGIAARLILNGTITLKGLRIPVDPEIYEPVLAELEKYGIVFKETTTGWQG